MPPVAILSPEQSRFLANARSATLATMSPSGRPRLVPICFVTGDEDGLGRLRLYSPLDEKPKRSPDPHDLARVHDLLVLPEVSLLVDRWSEDWSRLAWLRLHGRGELLEPEPHERVEHVAASRQFELLVNDSPAGLPHPDGALQMHQAGRDSRSALQDYMRALKRFTDFTLNGTVPEDLLPPVE